MKEPRDPKVYLDYIAESVRFILDYTAGISKDQFLINHQIQDAVIRRFQVMGDAAKSIPQDFKDQHPDISWRGMMTQRDVIVHDYFDINFERLWQTIQTDLPGLEKGISKILKSF